MQTSYATVRSAGFNPFRTFQARSWRHVAPMVEFVLIRLAEIRAEAAQEEYDLAHPREAALRKRLRWLRIKAKLLALWAAATPPAVWCRRRAALLHAWLRAQYNVLALAFTRRLGVPPPRAVAEQLPVKGLLLELPVKGLLLELQLRGASRGGLGTVPTRGTERGDLINALCGPPPPPPPSRPRSQSLEDYEPCEDENV